MKKSILFSALTLFSFCVSAQTHLIGLQGGLNLSNTQTPEEANNDQEFRIASISGITYEWLLNDRYSFSADVLFNQQGYIRESQLRDNNNNDLGKLTTVSQYDYISVPIKFGYAFGDKLRFTPKIGLMTSFLTNARYKAIDRGDLFGNFTGDRSEDTEKVDLAAMVEVALDYRFQNNLSVFSSLSYRNSFTNFSTPDDRRSFNRKEYHYGIALSIGVKYNLAS